MRRDTKTTTANPHLSQQKAAHQPPGRGRTSPQPYGRQSTVSQPKVAASPKMSQRQSVPILPTGVSPKSGTARPGQAPPVYRPQPTVSQPKRSVPSWPQRPPTKPVTGLPKPTAPPVYRPQAAVSQPKMQAPPVFQPQSAAFIPPQLRVEFSVAQPKSVAPPAAFRPLSDTSQAKLPGVPVVPSQVRGAQSKRSVASVFRGVVMAKGSPYGFHSRTIQRKTGLANGLKEAETVTFAMDKAVTFTSLAAGCMAVTACFDEGGGAALHLAMAMDNAAQWDEFFGLVEGKTISKIFVDCDVIGWDQGWLVKSTYDEDGMPVSDTTVGPTSYLELDNKKASTADWTFDAGSIIDWFAAKFTISKDKIVWSKKTKGVTHFNLRIKIPK
jgi:hypothetical protein